MFNPSLLGNPRPSAGQSNPFAPRADAGPRGGASSTAAALQNPTLHNRAGVMTNPTISYPFLSRPWSCGEDRSISEGSLLFVYRDGQHETANFRRKRNQLVVMANLPVINAKFDRAHIDLGHARNQSDKEREELEKRMKTQRITNGFVDIKSFMKHWNFVGVMRNESNPRNKFQRLLNVDVRGRSRVRNIWDEKKLKVGDKLYLKVSKVTRSVDARHRTDPLGKQMAEAYMTFDERMIQVHPAVNVTYKKDDEEDTVYIPIGIVSNALRKKPNLNTQRAWRDGEVLRTLDFIEIYVGIGNR